MALILSYSTKIPVKKLNNIIILFLIAILLVLTVELFSILTFLLFLSFSILLYWIFFRELDFSSIILLFCIYTIVAIGIYWMQFYQFPVNNGCTGAGIHGGTDDLFYYQEAIHNGISYRGDRSNFMHPYSRFLQAFSYLIGIYKKPKLLDLLFVNILAFSFIPVITRKVAEFLNFNEQSAKLTFLMSAICPIMIINGLVLVRDGWTAMLLILSIYFLLNKKLILLFLSIALTFYLRVSSAGIVLLFILTILFFADKKELPRYKFENRAFYITLVVIFLIINISAIIYFLKFTTLLDNLIFRKDFLSFIKETSNSKSAANFIYNLTPALRIPLGFFFYLGSPFLSMSDIWYKSFITITPLLEQIFPFLFIVYFILFIQFIGLFIRMKKNSIMSLLFISFLISILILSQLSMQPRHKTMVMPVFYLIVGYGSQSADRKTKILGFSIIACLFVLEMIYNFL